MENKIPNRLWSPWLALLRPKQWIKNAFCLAGLAFSGRYGEPASIGAALLCTTAFCVASSAVYILNDLRDREVDRLHPVKKDRPLASGAIRPRAAAALLLLLAVGGLSLAAVLPWPSAASLAAYALLQTVYSLGLKNHPLLDVVAIALGFVLRLLAGVYAVREIPTTWITLSTFFLAIFLGLCKRRAELAAHPEAAAQRPALAPFNLASLDSLITASAAATTLFYSLFCVLSGKNPTLIATVPLVYYAISRYQTKVWNASINAEEPETILLRDVALQVVLVLWLLLYFVITASDVHLFR